MRKGRIIFHIDVNSAYLSWEAAYRLQMGESIDLREIPSAVGGNPETRHGIILAKSLPAKKYKISTGETLHSAYEKCPHLTVVAPNYSLYISCSNAMVSILKEYTPKVQRFSVDECFLDFSHMDNLYEDEIELAHIIKDRIKKELGFTVNIGISSNKLLAKMASDFKSPIGSTLYSLKKYLLKCGLFRWKSYIWLEGQRHLSFISSIYLPLEI